jgi:hypothetical protein
MNLIKKVPDLTSWLPIQPNVWIPSPYLICPHPVLASENELLAECINNFVNPPDYETDPYWNTPVGHYLVVTRQLVCGQFIRHSLDKDFKDWKMPRHWRKTVKDQLNSHAELMRQIWRIIKLLPLSRNPRPLVFHEINLEGALIFFDFNFKEEGCKIAAATDLVKDQQKFNRNLQYLENPFEPSLEPATWSFIEECRKFAARSNEFRSDYMKLVQARMHLVALIQKSHPKKIDQSGKHRENRGRKSISSSRMHST